MTLDRTLLAAELRRDEGVRRFPYADTMGNWTIGCGRNLSANGVSEPEITLLLDNDINRAVADLDARWPWWRTLDPVRQRVMANLAFNLGASRLSGFTRFLTAAENHQYFIAAQELTASLWASQVGARATRLIAMMRDGSADPPVA